MKIRITKDVEVQGVTLSAGEVYEAEKTLSPRTQREAYQVVKDRNYILVFQHECEVVR